MLIPIKGSQLESFLSNYNKEKWKTHNIEIKNNYHLL
jgi:hypothetical protein